MRTALFILAYSSSSGLVLLSDKIRPRYLTLFTVVIFILLTIRLPLNKHGLCFIYIYLQQVFSAKVTETVQYTLQFFS